MRSVMDRKLQRCQSSRCLILMKWGSVTLEAWRDYRDLTALCNLIEQAGREPELLEDQNRVPIENRMVRSNKGNKSRRNDLAS